MQWIERMNMVIEYIEGKLSDEIDPIDISRIMGCPYSVFLRTFAPITGIYFSEYIRRRRLSCSVYDLLHTDMRVVDIAIKYGYTSSNAFSNAFKKLHGFAPANIKGREKDIVFYPKLEISLNVTGMTGLKYSIRYMDAFSVIGIKMKVCENENAWERFDKCILQNELTEYIGRKCNLGICFGYDREGNNDYMCAAEYSGEQNTNFDYYHFPKLAWVVFNTKGKISEDIFHNVENRIYREFIPQSMYNILEFPVVQ